MPRSAYRGYRPTKPAQPDRPPMNLHLDELGQCCRKGCTLHTEKNRVYCPAHDQAGHRPPPRTPAASRPRANQR